jgi:hypothetical protein
MKKTPHRHVGPGLTVLDVVDGDENVISGFRPEYPVSGYFGGALSIARAHLITLLVTLKP